jgi:dinuclear metal center YbgI/SA1388 family protein
MREELKIKHITDYLEVIAPLSYQEIYDNAGLIVGDAQMPVTDVLLTLDCTEAVVDEAIAKGCNLIIAHHPIVFKGLKKFNGRNYVERTVIKAIKNDVAIYAIHTNLDNVLGGVNSMIAEKLGLQNIQILAPKTSLLSKLAVFVPATHTQRLLDALHMAGAGQIGNYEACSFTVTGTGTFMPNDFANPFIGKSNVLEQVIEDRIEVVFPNYLQSKILTAMKSAHPYEEVAYYLSALNNDNQEVGAGAVGELTTAVHTHEWLLLLKKQMSLKVIKHTNIIKNKVQRIALCGGSGGFLLNDAIQAQADVFVTADYKYHEFFDADNRIMICDIGHYESEVCTKELLHQFLSKKFTTFAIILSETNTNPVSYFI